MSKKWYNWPQNYYEKNWRPWHGIVRMILALPFILVGFGILYVGAIINDGVWDAEQIRKDLF